MIQPQPNPPSGTIPYEQRLDADFEWALREGSMHFEEANAVHKALRRVTKRLEELGVPYAVAGGMALFFHGYRRFTEDVDILVARESLKVIHENLEGRGYLPPFAGSKNLRDTEFGVKIDFLVSGDHPGDGKPKPVSFPNPAEVATEIQGINFLSLEKLIELKLASGMAPHRRKDLGDVQELIRLLDLPGTFKARLNSYVQPLFQELWDGVKQAPPAPDEG